jgi:hypothetical protein
MNDAFQMHQRVLTAEHCSYAFRFGLAEVNFFSKDIENQFGPGAVAIFR